jgi:hypothetical protein
MDVGKGGLQMLQEGLSTNEPSQLISEQGSDAFLFSVLRKRALFDGPCEK